MSRLGTDFSESTFAFAFTGTLLRDPRFAAIGAPRFLSTYAEGKGQHFDVELPAHPVAFFFQFKIPEVMQRGRGLKAGGKLEAPFYRMNLRREKRYTQHRGLLAFEAQGKNIYYACPRFHTGPELDRLFSRGEIHEYSAWFRPSGITPADYTSPHGVVYDVAGRAAEIRSNDPRGHDGPFGFEAFAKAWTEAVKRAPKQKSAGFFTNLIGSLQRAQDIALGELRRLQAGLTEMRSRSDKDGLELDVRADGASSIQDLPPVRQGPAMTALNLARSLFGLEILVGGHD